MSESITTNSVPVLLYTEQTPNPETLKFVCNKMLFDGTAEFKNDELAKEWSPIAMALFELPFIKVVYISKNFVTITKEFNYSWDDISLKIKEFIKQYIMSGKTIVKEGYLDKIILEANSNDLESLGDNPEIAIKIKQLIDAHVKPAVAQDGGNIEFKSYKNGKVYVVMQGACSGCPSSTITLKSGIEGMLKRMVPEVEEVISEME